MNTSVQIHKPWQKSPWTQGLAIVLGYAFPLTVFIAQVYEVDLGFITRRDEANSAWGYLFYAMVYTLFVIAVLLVLIVSHIDALGSFSGIFLDFNPSFFNFQFRGNRNNFV